MFFFSWFKSSISITTKPTNMEICMYTYFFLVCALSGYVFVNPFISYVTDCYQHKQCIIMETKTETNMKIACIDVLLVVCATCCYIFINPFTSCVTACYLPSNTDS